MDPTHNDLEALDARGAQDDDHAQGARARAGDNEHQAIDDDDDHQEDVYILQADHVLHSVVHEPLYVQHQQDLLVHVQHGRTHPHRPERDRQT